MFEYAPIPTPEQSTEYGPAYDEIVRTIEAGKQKSRGYNTDKVAVNGREIPLPEYLATELFRIRNSGELTKAGVDKILETYLTPDVPRDMGATSLAATNRGRYHSGAHEYRDFRSAAAGDHDD